MNITPISFAGKKEINAYAEQFAPLAKEEQVIKEMAENFYDIEVDRTSDGDYITGSDQAYRQLFLDTLKSQALYKSTFAYNIALDAAKAPANDAVCRGGDDFREAARDIAKHNPEITKERVLLDFDKLK